MDTVTWFQSLATMKTNPVTFVNFFLDDQAMTRFALTIVLLVLGALASDHRVSAGMITVNFDDDSKWLRAPSTAITTYSINHRYVDQGFTFTGGMALRDGVAAQDSQPSGLGTYSWRLQNASGVTWTATYSSVSFNQIASLSFAARRWDNDPSPNYDVHYSDNGGSSFTHLIRLDNAAFDNSSAWKTFSFDFVTQVLTNNQFIVRFASVGSTERIMIDNFSVTAVPEPTSLVMVALAGMGGFAARRFKRKRLEGVALKSTPA